MSSIKGALNCGFQTVGKPFKSTLSSMSSNKTYSISCVCIKQSVSYCRIAGILMSFTLMERVDVLSPTRSLMMLKSVAKQVQHCWFIPSIVRKYNLKFEQTRFSKISSLTAGLNASYGNFNRNL